MLTIVTPVYNGQRFIESCLQSVINQNCPDVEHLIVDGGSTDMTPKIIERYAKRYVHIRWISEKDNGQSAAMNKGISMAQGRIIGFLNCDDYYEPAVLTRILKIIKQLPDPSFLVGNCNVLNDDERITYLNKPSRLSLTNILIGGEKNQFPYNPSAYFYHKSLHKRIGPYDESNHYTMDVDFLLRAVRSAHIKYVDETWGNYRFIRGTKTFQSKEDNQLEVNKARVMNVYFKELPWFHQWWIKMNRHIQYILDKHNGHYYIGRIQDCFRDPREIQIFILKRFNLAFPRSSVQRQSQNSTEVS
ncbi:MAG: glycosyltransferase [Candidatus Omnitrophica bacterium]|nr:glycosyltransferase [Candidatus Omnitrophota bacterium]